MAAPSPSPAQSRALWAKAWLEVSGLIDLQLSPLGLAAIEALSPRSGEIIVDVGCGAGQTVLQLAERVGPQGQVIGVDIAPTLLDVGRRSAKGLPQAHFLEADATELDLPDQSVDALFSRFGVMAFPDPVKTFANLRRILKPDGRLAFVCWRALQDNELDRLPLGAAALETPIDRTPFSFEDPDVTRRTLEAAGFRGIAIRAHDEAVSCGGLDATMAVMLRVGPLGRIIRENPHLREAVEPRLRAALAIRDYQGHVALNAATWIVTALA